jgi:hypothetical protein
MPPLRYLITASRKERLFMLHSTPIHTEQHLNSFRLAPEKGRSLCFAFTPFS